MTDKLDSQIDRFFGERMLPLATKAKSAGVRFLETGFERDAPTYYVQRSRKTMSKADFESGGCVSPETVEADLQALWRDERSTGLNTLSAGMAALAKDLRTVSKDESEVSNFTYVMF
ncbi:MAG TPA: hypothetical protein VGI48_10335 [Caldimonas sp.]|jgi:hypothetical protein